MKRKLMKTSLITFDKDGKEKEEVMHLSRIDSSKKGVLVWPGGDKTKHIHYFIDSKTGKLKAFIKYEDTNERYETNISLTQLEDLVIKKLRGLK